MPGDGICLEVAKGTVRVLQATVVKYHRDLVFAIDMAQDIYRTSLLHYLFGSTARNGIALKGPIGRLSFSGLPSVDMASRKQFDLCPCFHPRNTSSGASTFYEDIVAQLYAGLIDGPGLAPEANTLGTEAAEMIERAIAQVIADVKSVTYKINRDRDDAVAAVTSQVAHTVI
jgi:isocitrate/isopropylmalate dehydrogenase